MNILFLSLLDFESIEERNIYTDLLREFVRKGHTVCAVSPTERKKKQPTKLLAQNEKVQILKLRIGNIQKTNLIEKGISTVTVEGMFIKGIKKYFSDIKFDLVLYTTPPITLQKAVNYVKRRDGSKNISDVEGYFSTECSRYGNAWKDWVEVFSVSLF